jgi:hypothetical protein
MRELAKRRLAGLSAEQRHDLAVKAGKARWTGLTEAQQKAAIKRLQKQRRAAARARRKEGSK